MAASVPRTARSHGSACNGHTVPQMYWLYEGAVTAVGNNDNDETNAVG